MNSYTAKVLILRGCAYLGVAMSISSNHCPMMECPVVVCVAALGPRGHGFESHGFHTLPTSPKNTFGTTVKSWGTILISDPTRILNG